MKLFQKMKALNVLCICAVSYIYTCSGHSVPRDSPVHLKLNSFVTQTVSVSREDESITNPLAHLKKYSEIHNERFQTAGESSNHMVEDNDELQNIISEEKNIIIEKKIRNKFDNEKEELLENETEQKDINDDQTLRIIKNKKLEPYLYKTTKNDLRLPDPRKFFWNLMMMAMGPYYLPSVNETVINNTQCVKDVELLHKPSGDWQMGNATILVDSWGKVPDGFLGGNIKSLGFMDECFHVRFIRDPSGDESSQGFFRGKYCYVNFIPDFNKQQNDHEFKEVKNGDPVNLPFIMAGPDFPGNQLVTYGTCMPTSCKEQNLADSLNIILEATNNSARVTCQTEDYPNVEFTAGLIAMIIILSIFGCLLLGAAAIDIWIQYTGKEELKNGHLKYLLVFSMYTNIEKMFKINTTENKEAITCFYGIRVLSMTWVVWGHQIAITIINNANLLYMPEIFNGHWMNQIIVNALPSVDTFFFLSGFLVAYGVMKEKQRTGKINIIVFYIHRFLRLGVPIMLLSGFLAVFTRYLVHGPLAPSIDYEGSLQDGCQKYWWRDAIFISNFYMDGGKQTTCLAVCWYTAVDFQLFIVTPIILLPFIWGENLRMNDKQKNTVGFVWLGIVTVVSVLIPGIITGIKHFPPTTILSLRDHKLGGEQNNQIYMRAWCRAQPYLVGFWLAILFRRDSKREIRLQKWQVIAGWLVATATGLAVVFGMYGYNQMGHYPGYNWADSVFYAALNRLSWGLALAWVVFACHYGYGGLVNSFLSHPSWQPLSRLTYCMFLVAIPMQEILYIYSFSVPSYYSQLNKVLETVAVLFVSGVGSVLLSLCTEAPVIGLEKHLLGRGK